MRKQKISAKCNKKMVLEKLWQPKKEILLLLEELEEAKSWAQLSDFTFTFHFHALEKEMVTHSSVLACRIPGMAEPGGLPSMGSHSRTRLK